MQMIVSACPFPFSQDREHLTESGVAQPKMEPSREMWEIVTTAVRPRRDGRHAGSVSRLPEGDKPGCGVQGDVLEIGQRACGQERDRGIGGAVDAGAAAGDRQDRK